MKELSGNTTTRFSARSIVLPLIITSMVIGVVLAVHLPVSDQNCSQKRLEVAWVSWESSNLAAEVINNGNTSITGLEVSVKPSDNSFRQPQYFNTTVKPGNSAFLTVDAPGPVETIRFRDARCSSSLAEHQMNNACPPGLALIDVSEVNRSTVDTSGKDDFCIFKYEASRADATATQEGNSTVAASQQGVVVWRDIVQDSEEGIAVNTYYPPSVEPPTLGAKQACQNAGYELVTNKQWQAATMAERGQPETWVHGNTNWGRYGNTDWDKEGDGLNETCIDDPTHSRLRNGSMEEKAICLTGTGPHDTWCTEQGVCDLVGNVAEWTSDFYGKGHECDIVNMESVNYSCNYQEQSRFSTYYIDSWDAEHACPASVSLCREPDFNNDYYTPPDDPPDGAVVRGGAWGHTVWGGPWTTVLYIPPSGWSHDIGFRCALG